MPTRSLVRASAACIALASFNIASAAAELQLPLKERSSAWFAPALVVNNRPVCAEALEAERASFFAPYEPVTEIPGLVSLVKHGVVVKDPDFDVLADYPLEAAFTLPDRTRAFIHFFRYSGCGSACESEAVVIDDARIVRNQFEGAHGYGSLELPHAVPRATQWDLYKTSQGDFYLKGVVENHARWYRAAAADRWELACDIALKPKVYSQEVSQAIESLHMAAARIAGGSGNCGSLRTGPRWSRIRAEGLETALYRPWAIVEHKDFESANSWQDYARITEQLELWSLGGLLEHRDFAAYQAQLAHATATVAEFYRAKFKWTPPRAAQMAEAALKGAISRGFGFYEYDPYPARGERQLRQAILSGAPIEQIRGIAVDVKAIDRPDEDSILNVAIEYPEALRYLLAKGFNPNTANAFGKTPLMYAAQYDVVTAAKMLLEAGADPNATTFLPEDTCTYVLRTSGLTPLHYATRYSSAALIKLLLERGAVTFSQSTSDERAEYPLDRLQRYAGMGVTNERNPHIAESEVVALAQLLAVPSEVQRSSIATELVSRARSEYARGDAQQAYQHLRTALLAQPDRPDATADLPLIALRAGYFGPAVVAAHRATQMLKAPGALAASWFNKGLICERPQAREAFSMRGVACERDPLEPFVKSWKTQPSPARANKLRALIAESAASCGSSDARRHYRLVDLYRSFRLYALHRPGEKIDPSQVRWPTKLSSTDRTTSAQAKRLESFELGGEVVTVLEVPRESGANNQSREVQISIENQVCTIKL